MVLVRSGETALQRRVRRRRLDGEMVDDVAQLDIWVSGQVSTAVGDRRGWVWFMLCSANALELCVHRVSGAGRQVDRRLPAPDLASFRLRYGYRTALGADADSC